VAGRGLASSSQARASKGQTRYPELGTPDPRRPAGCRTVGTDAPRKDLTDFRQQQQRLAAPSTSGALCPTCLPVLTLASEMRRLPRGKPAGGPTVGHPRAAPVRRVAPPV
jgi:hypothetical protein